MASREAYAKHLSSLREWRSYLVKNSGLPGPRGNIELAQAVADLGTAELFQRYLDLDDSKTASDSEKEYLVFCGVLGLGRLAAEGTRGYLDTLKRYASDPRWRIREAVAMALQRIGLVDMNLLLRTARKWISGGWLEQRAAAAGLCEPALLHDREHAAQALEVLHAITARMAKATDRRTDAFRALRKGMGYCWSVAVAASPREGKKRMERWMDSADADVAWVMKENLGKNRMVRMDPGWVEKWIKHLRQGVRLQDQAAGA
jgi:hypothetical protein